MLRCLQNIWVLGSLGLSFNRTSIKSATCLFGIRPDWPGIPWEGRWGREPHTPFDRIIRPSQVIHISVNRGQPRTEKQERRHVIRWADVQPTQSYEFLLGTNQRSKSFGQQGGVEWLLERFVDAGPIKANRTAIVRKQGDQDCLREIAISLQILTDLQCFDFTD